VLELWAVARQGAAAVPWEAPLLPLGPLLPCLDPAQQGALLLAGVEPTYMHPAHVDASGVAQGSAVPMRGD